MPSPSAGRGSAAREDRRYSHDHARKRPPLLREQSAVPRRRNRVAQLGAVDGNWIRTAPYRRAWDEKYRCWPALHVADAEGAIAFHHFGEGRYGGSERVIQALLDQTGGLAEVEGEGVEAAADWTAERPRARMSPAGGCRSASAHATSIWTWGPRKARSPFGSGFVSTETRRVRPAESTSTTAPSRSRSSSEEPKRTCSPSAG